MGNILGNQSTENVSGYSDTQLELFHNIDKIAANYVTTLNIKNLKKLASDSYCKQVELITKELFYSKMNFHDIKHLYKEKIEGSNELKEKDLSLIIVDKEDNLSKDENKLKNTYCRDLAKYYAKIATTFASIAMTIYPHYNVKGNKYSIFELYGIGEENPQAQFDSTDLESSEVKKRRRKPEFKGFCEQRVRMLMSIINEYKKRQGFTTFGVSDNDEETNTFKPETQGDVITDSQQGRDFDNIADNQQLGGHPEVDENPSILPDIPPVDPITELPVEQMPGEQIQAEQILVEQMPAEQIPVEQMPVEQMPVEQMPDMPEGEMPPAESDTSGMGEMPPPDMPEGEMPPPDMSEGEMPPPDMPEGEMPPPDMPEGEMPPPDMSEGEMPLPESDTSENVDLSEPKNIKATLPKCEFCTFPPLKDGQINDLPNIEQLFNDQFIIDSIDIDGDGMMQEKMPRFEKSEKMKKIYDDSLRKFYKAYTGETNYDEWNADKNKNFQDIPIFSYSNKYSSSCNDLEVDNVDENEITKMMINLADHKRKMVIRMDDQYMSLIRSLGVLFAYVENDGKKQPVVHPKLNETKLNTEIDNVRNIVLNLYSECEEDFKKGLEIYENMVNKIKPNRDNERSKSLIGSLFNVFN